MYVVIGANGYIGSYVIKNILEKTTDNIIALGRHIELSFSSERIQCMRCDITKDVDLLCLKEKCDLLTNIKVIYLASYHHPDDVKKNPQLAWEINIIALAKILNMIKNVKCLFYISTEMVYGDGTLEYKFLENDELNPVNLYGKHKKIAEALVTGAGYNIVRFPFVIGPSLLPKKKHFYDIIVETLKAGKEIEMFEDSYKSALDFDTATDIIVRLAENYEDSMPSILNVAGDDILSKYEIACLIARKHGLDTTLIKPIKMIQNTSIFKENRANCTLLNNSLLKEVLGLNEVKMKF